MVIKSLLFSIVLSFLLISNSVFAGELVINLNKQRFAYIVDGHTKKSGPVSSGKRGHRTPRGNFSILSKQRHKKSKLYQGASMPYSMQIYNHIFIHQGRLPGYAASHGCIRLRRKDARYLFGRMK